MQDTDLKEIVNGFNLEYEGMKKYYKRRVASCIEVFDDYNDFKEKRKDSLDYVLDEEYLINRNEAIYYHNQFIVFNRYKWCLLEFKKKEDWNVIHKMEIL